MMIRSVNYVSEERSCVVIAGDKSSLRYRDVVILLMADDLHAKGLSLRKLKGRAGVIWLVYQSVFWDWIAVAGLISGGCASIRSRIFWIMSGSVISVMTRTVPPHNQHYPAIGH